MIFSYGIIFISVFFGFISIADISLALMAVISLIKYKSIKWDNKKLLLILYVLTTFIPFLLYKDKAYFDLSQYMLSNIKHTFYFISYLLVPRLLFDNSKKFNIIVYRVLKLTIFLGLFQLIDYYIPINLYSGYSHSSLTYGFFRISSVYSEPSLFFFSVLLYYYLIFEKVKITPKYHILMFISTILTFSMTVYVVYFFGLFAFNTNKVKIRKPSKRKLTILILIIISIIIIYMKVPLIQVHVGNLLEFKPSSATTRLFGGLEYAFRAPFWGVGVGNEKTYYINNAGNLALNYFSSGGAVNNILAVVKLYNGYLGLVLLMSYLIMRYGKSCFKFLSIIFVSFFAWGYYNTSGFFLILILLEVYYMQRKAGGRYD